MFILPAGEDFHVLSKEQTHDNHCVSHSYDYQYFGYSLFK